MVGFSMAFTWYRATYRSQVHGSEPLAQRTSRRTEYRARVNNTGEGVQSTGTAVQGTGAQEQGSGAEICSPWS